MAHKTKQHKLKAALLAGNKEATAQLQKEAATLKPVPAPVQNYIPFSVAELNTPYIGNVEE